jgi:peptidoglycan/LPS O-acetylase OafA/YrhL
MAMNAGSPRSTLQGRMHMESPPLRRSWRLIFLLVTVVAAPFASAFERPDADRLPSIAAWVALAALYAGLAWSARDKPGPGKAVDLLVVVFFLLAAFYATSWGGRFMRRAPSGTGGILAAVALGALISTAVRARRRERATTA